MNRRTVRLLHVEDEAGQRRFVAHYLASIPEFDFDVRYAAGEEEALAGFQGERPDCVILDYHLEQGDGLSCLRRLRALDSFVPILVVSGEATPETACELLQAGADDYLTKRGITGAVLGRSIREALARADAWRHLPPPRTEEPERDALFEELCAAFAGLGEPFLRRLDQWESAARKSGLNERQLHHLFEHACRKMSSALGVSAPTAERLLRPLLLEVAFRLFEPPPEDCAATQPQDGRA